MALKPCRECGEQVSSKADKCPNCGVNSPTRNTVLNLAVWAIIAFFFIAIIVSEDEEGSSATSTGNNEQVEQTTTSSSDQEKIDWEPVIDAVEKSKEAGFLTRIEKVDRSVYVDPLMWRTFNAETKENSVLTFARYMGYLNDMDQAVGITVKDSQSGRVVAEYGMWNGVEIK